MLFSLAQESLDFDFETNLTKIRTFLAKISATKDISKDIS